MDVRLHPTADPLWWRLPTWAVLTALTVYNAHSLHAQIAAGVLMAVSAIVLQVLPSAREHIGQAALLLCIATAVAACCFSHGGAAEILILVAAGRAPQFFHGRALGMFVVVATIAFGVTIAIIADDLTGLLAGIAIPFIVQRSLDHQELIRERDRAQALLAEVQRGRESEAQAAALQERGRIAREMHDVLAHSLAGLSVQLQAIRAVAAHEHVVAAVTEPLDRAADLAREGLAEARAVVSTLRDPDGLGIDALPALVARHPGVAELGIEGEGQVDPAAGHAIYRAVQESLTNAARYAPGSPVEVTVRWQTDAVVVTVSDIGPLPGRVAVAGQGTGLGLAGMSERLAQVAGSMSSGPDGTGWRVELRVPATGPAAEVLR